MAIWIKFWRFLRKDRDHEWHMIDATHIRAHHHAAGARGGQDRQELGRSCGGFPSKIHAKVDVLGMPLNFVIAAGQRADISQAQALMGNDPCEHLLADKGYDRDHLRQFLELKKITPVIPGKRNRLAPIHHDQHIYKEHHAVERLFARLKEFRRIAYSI